MVAFSTNKTRDTACLLNYFIESIYLEAGLYEARTRKKALLEQIYKAVSKYRSENEIVQCKKKRKKADIESIIELEKALVPEEELFSCYVCTKTFLFDVDRRKHLRYHEREARFLR